MIHGTIDKKEKRWTVYRHIMPNGKMYVGITSMKPSYRWNDGQGYKTQKHLFNAINKYGWDNIRHEILLDNLTVDEASLAEKIFIGYWDLTNPNKGYNHETGGYVGGTWSDASKRKMSKRVRGEGNPMYGKTHTQETKQKISAKNAGKSHPHTTESRRKIGDAHRGIKHHYYHKHLSKEHCERILDSTPLRKSVLQLDKDTGKIITEFKSIRLAERITGILHQNIGQCCKGLRKTAGGYGWKYKD